VQTVSGAGTATRSPRTVAIGGHTVRLVWLVIAAGLLLRVVIAFATFGHGYDIAAWRTTGAAFNSDPLHVYEAVNKRQMIGPLELFVWPYPPGFMPWTAGAIKISQGLGLPFHGVVQLLPIAADAGIAWIVQDFLGRQGASAGVRVGATMLVAFGPVFAEVSGYWGQFDSVAALPAVAALYAWETSQSGRRAVWAGMLLGLAGAIKTAPIVVVLALLPSSRNLREAARLLVVMGAVLLAICAPYLVSQGGELVHALRYASIPGVGGLSLLVQPDLAKRLLMGGYPGEFSGASLTLYHHASTLVIAGLAVIGLFLLRFRPSAAEASVFLWLGFFIFMPNFAAPYTLWALPFFLMAGHLRKVALLQLVLLPVLIFFYVTPWKIEEVAVAYTVIMLSVWAAFIGAFAVQGARIARSATGGWSGLPGAR
jgi:glycosyl transferase family 87